VKAAVPGKVIDTGGGFEEDDRCAAWLRFFASYFARDRCDLDVIKSADKSTFDALGEEFLHDF
jgi:hypothetical protein